MAYDTSKILTNFGGGNDFGHADYNAARKAGISNDDIISWMDDNSSKLIGKNVKGGGGLYDEIVNEGKARQARNPDIGGNNSYGWKGNSNSYDEDAAYGMLSDEEPDTEDPVTPEPGPEPEDPFTPTPGNSADESTGDVPDNFWGGNVATKGGNSANEGKGDVPDSFWNKNESNFWGSVGGGGANGGNDYWGSVKGNADNPNRPPGMGQGPAQNFLGDFKKGLKDKMGMKHNMFD